MMFRHSGTKVVSRRTAPKLGRFYLVSHGDIIKYIQKINMKISLKDIDKINKTAYNIYNSTRRAS